MSDKTVSPRRTTTALGVIFQPKSRPPRLGMLEDLHEGGARLDATKPCVEGELMAVYLPWPSSEEPTELAATVRTVEGRRMGLEFASLSADAERAIAGVCEMALLSEQRAVPAPSGDHDLFGREALLAVRECVHSVERRVRFHEVDAAGTIYYARVFEYFGDVYVDLYERGGAILQRALTERQWFAPLVHAEAEYLAPMRFGDSVRVEVAKVRCGRSSATVGYRVLSPDNRPLAVGHTVHVFVDCTTFRPCSIPEVALRALTAKVATEAP